MPHRRFIATYSIDAGRTALQHGLTVATVDSDVAVYSIPQLPTA